MSSSAGQTGRNNPKELKMRRHNLLPALSIALFVAYSVIATTTGGALVAAASPMLVVAIAAMIWHDRIETAA